LNNSMHGMSGIKSNLSITIGEQQPIPRSDTDTKIGSSIRRSMSTVVLDHLCDWSICRPGHRNIITELGDRRFSVEIPGEPLVYIFCRALNQDSSNRSWRLREGTSATPRSDPSRAGSGFTYLVEVHYYLRLETNAVRVYST
jgi:hypothetical protein